MAVMCREHGLLFILNPRTASSAVARVLRSELAGETVPADDLRSPSGKLLVDSKHGTLGELLKHGLVEASEAQRLFKFTTVRNPFDSLVSLYVKKSGKLQAHLERRDSWIHKKPGYAEDVLYCRDHSFDEWIERRYSSTALHRVLKIGRRSRFDRYTEGLDFVMKKEQLTADFAEVLRRAGIRQPIQVPRFHPTADREPGYRSYYSRRSRKLVEHAFGPDLRRYGYAF